MARRYSRRVRMQGKAEDAGLFTLDHEAELWLARAALHQVQGDPSEVALQQSTVRALKLKLSADDDDDDDQKHPRRRGDPRKRQRSELLLALQERVEQLRPRAERAPGRLTRAARRIGEVVELSELEARVIAWLAACELHGELALLSRIGELQTEREKLLLAAAALDVAPKRLAATLARRAPLQKRGLVEPHDTDGGISSFSLPRKVLALFGAKRASADHVLSSLLATGPAPRFTLADFEHLRELPLLSHLLAGALARPAGPVHILLHGPPGTGKSELARALAASVHARLCEVPTEDDDGDELSASGRATELRLLDTVAAAQRGRYCILVDEADAVLPRRERSLFGGFLGGSVEGKGFYNELLEGTRTPVLWTVNTPQSLDAAHVRRFSLIVSVEAPSRARREAIAAHHAQAAGIDPAILQEVAADERVPLALLETIQSTITTMRASAGGATVSALPARPDEQKVAHHVVSGYLRLHGEAPKSQPRPTSLAFDPSLLNASLDLSAVSARLRERPQATVLLSGPPGAGKSAWARELAASLGRALMVRAPSDILSKYVGEAEKNLAKAFAQAEAEGAVLLLDEADTFLFPRGEASRSWEVSQVNEMLQRVEGFQGILIATTNSERLDEAIHRRFDLKVELRPLTAAQRARLFASLCAVLGLPAPGAEDVARVGALDKLCAGDFVAAERRLAFTPPAGAADVVSALEEERAVKRGAGKARIGF